MKRSKPTTTSTFDALQKFSCTEARQGRREVRPCRILMRTVPSRKRVASYLQFSGQVHNGNTGVELKGAISRNRIRCILAILAAI